MNDMVESWEAIPIKKVRAAIDKQRDIHLDVLASNDRETVYQTDLIIAATVCLSTSFDVLLTFELLLS